MTVRCKMRVTEKADRANHTGAGKQSTSVKLYPVGGPGNETWSKWTPSGELSLNITNQAAVDAFELGACYYVDFTPAPEVEEVPKAAPAQASLEAR